MFTGDIVVPSTKREGHDGDPISCPFWTRRDAGGAVRGALEFVHPQSLGIVAFVDTDRKDALVQVVWSYGKIGWSFASTLEELERT